MLVAVVVMAMTVAVTVIVMIGVGGSGAVTGPVLVGVFVRVDMHRRNLHSTRSGLWREARLALSGHFDTLPS